jgi:hypothetical protein
MLLIDNIGCCCLVSVDHPGCWVLMGDAIKTLQKEELRSGIGMLGIELAAAVGEGSLAKGRARHGPKVSEFYRWVAASQSGLLLC